MTPISRPVVKMQSNFFGSASCQRRFYASGYVATALVALAVIAVILTKPRKGRRA